jgi:hypothetical protein
MKRDETDLAVPRGTGPVACALAAQMLDGFLGPSRVSPWSRHGPQGPVLRDPPGIYPFDADQKPRTTLKLGRRVWSKLPIQEAR